MRTMTKMVLFLTLLAPLHAVAADATAVAPAAVAVAAPDAAVAAPAPAVAPTVTPATPAPEKAAEPAKDVQAWWKGILVTLIEAAVAILLPILSILLVALARKWGLKIEQDKLDWILDKALGFAEQKAKVALKDGKPMEGPEIAKMGVTHGTELLEKYGLAKKFGSWLADGIEARLGQAVVDNGGRNIEAAEVASAASITGAEG